MLEYNASAQAVTFLERLSPGQRRQLRAVLDRMALHPPRDAMVAFADSAGRPLHIGRDGDFEILLWIDHAARELRIVEVELIRR